MSYALVRLSLLVAGISVLLPAAAVSQDEIREETIRFARGATGATVQDSIRGYETVDYLLGASAGQYLNVSMATDHASNYFNVLAPGEDAVAMFVGSISGNQYEGTLPSTGDYRIRVYLMRSAARRAEAARYRLDMIIGAAGEARTGVDATVPGTDYHATGQLPCSMGAGQPAGFCDFGVVREGDGTGMVTITKPDGRTRTIFFENGTAIGADVSEADPGEFSARKESDLSTVRIGEERYEIPDAIIFGG
jgi:hypothetical protein